MYFDELGPPWTKHGCTDKANLKLKAPPSQKITPRAKGVSKELTHAFQALYTMQTTPKNIDWQLFLIEGIERIGFENHLIGQILDQIDQSKTKFSFTSELEMVSVGEVISISTTHISVIDMKKLNEKRYKIRDLFIPDFIDKN